MRQSRLLTTALAAATALLLVAADEPALVEATEELYISAGCPQSTPGTCTSTRWLGKQTGDATSNFLTSTTPADEVLYRADGSLNWRDYPSDLSFAGYLLDDTRDLGVTVAISAHTQGGVGAEVTVHARLSANLTLANGTVTTRTLTVDPQTVPLVTSLDGSVPVDFAFDLPEEFAGATLNRMTVEVALHGVNVRAGYIDQQGGSPVTIPHLVPAA